MTADTIYYALATLTSLILLTRAFLIWRGQLDLFLFILCAFSSSLWSMTVLITGIETNTAVINFTEILRYGAFFLFLYFVACTKTNQAHGVALTHYKIPITLSLTGFILLIISGILPINTVSNVSSAFEINNLGLLCLALSGLIILLLINRSLTTEQKLNTHYLILGMALIFTYDVFCFSIRYLFESWEHHLLAARGVITAIASFIFIFTLKTNMWNKRVSVSHSTARHTTLLILSLCYLSLIAGITYWVVENQANGSGLTLAFVLIIASFFLVTLYTSEQKWAYIKVFLNKHFYNYKYEYREEWLRFIRTLSQGGPGAHLLETVIEALAQIVGSRGGLLWLRTDNGHYDLVTHSNFDPPNCKRKANDCSLARFLENWQWIIDLDEYEKDKELYHDLQLPDWITADKRVWLIVPLMQDVELLGFVMLPHPEVKHTINWEDHDLLKTAGRQAATHLAQLLAVQALVEAREFQAFNKLAAFVIHDLKNLVAQLSLVVSNAQKHKHNPEFMEDAIHTVDHSVSKMNRLLTQLKKGHIQSDSSNQLNIIALLKQVIDERSYQDPKPTFHSSLEKLNITANKDRLSATFEHLIQNAQDATPPYGEVTIKADYENEQFTIHITDNGCGMDSLFIRDRLFRPFDSTKGQGGMGIGAYESREYIRELNGDLSVHSKPGKGTTFTLILPEN